MWHTVKSLTAVPNNKINIAWIAGIDFVVKCSHFHFKQDIIKKIEKNPTIGLSIIVVDEGLELIEIDISFSWLYFAMLTELNMWFSGTERWRCARHCYTMACGNKWGTIRFSHRVRIACSADIMFLYTLWRHSVDERGTRVVFDYMQSE